MKISYYSPMPPARSGIADYSNWLVRELRRQAEVEVNPETPTGRAVYHIGNNHLHRDIYQLAIARPGIVVIHDAVLHHFHLGMLEERAYVEEFVYNYGEWSRGLAIELWKNRRRSGADARYFQYPMLRRIAESAECVVVHNRGAAELVLQHAPNARIVEVPHLYEPPGWIDPVVVERLRASWGARPSSCVFGVFGHLREAKRIAVTLRAFERVRIENPKVFLLLAGAAGSLDMVRALAGYSEIPGVIRVGHTPEADFLAMCGAADVGINLRYPSAGETSGITIRLMGMGKPVIVSDGPETSSLPVGVCLKIPVTAAEEATLAEYMKFLAGNRSQRLNIGSLAARHIQQYQSIGRVVKKYLDILVS